MFVPVSILPSIPLLITLNVSFFLRVYSIKKLIRNLIPLLLYHKSFMSLLFPGLHSPYLRFEWYSCTSNTRKLSLPPSTTQQHSLKFTLNLDIVLSRNTIVILQTRSRKLVAHLSRIRTPLVLVRLIYTPSLYIHVSDIVSTSTFTHFQT